MKPTPTNIIALLLVVIGVCMIAISRSKPRTYALPPISKPVENWTASGVSNRWLPGKTEEFARAIPVPTNMTLDGTNLYLETREGRNLMTPAIAGSQAILRDSKTGDLWIFWNGRWNQFVDQNVAATNVPAPASPSWIVKFADDGLPAGVVQESSHKRFSVLRHSYDVDHLCPECVDLVIGIALLGYYEHKAGVTTNDLTSWLTNYFAHAPSWKEAMAVFEKAKSERGTNFVSEDFVGLPIVKDFHTGNLFGYENGQWIEFERKK